jgi:hypothetical protein
MDFAPGENDDCIPGLYAGFDNLNRRFRRGSRVDSGTHRLQNPDARHRPWVTAAGRQ